MVINSKGLEKLGVFQEQIILMTAFIIIGSLLSCSLLVTGDNG